MKSGKFPVSTVAFISFLALASPVPAQASNWSGASGDTGCSGGIWGDGINMADDYWHTFIYVDLTPTVHDGVNWSLINNLNPTDMQASGVSAITSETDLIVRDQAYEDYCGADWFDPKSGGGVGGMTVCNSANAAHKCRSHTVRITTRLMESKKYRTLEMHQYIACHEIGHSVGLKHRDAMSSCLKSGGIERSQLPARYDSHDIAHLNSNY